MSESVLMYLKDLYFKNLMNSQHEIESNIRVLFEKSHYYGTSLHFFSQVLHHFSSHHFIPNVQEKQFLMPSIWYVVLKRDSLIHLEWYLIAAQNCVYLKIRNTEHCLHISIGNLYILFVEMCTIFKSLILFYSEGFFKTVNCRISLNCLDVNISSNISFVNIIFPILLFVISFCCFLCFSKDLDL